MAGGAALNGKKGGGSPHLPTHQTTCLPPPKAKRQQGQPPGTPRFWGSGVKTNQWCAAGTIFDSQELRCPGTGLPNSAAEGLVPQHLHLLWHSLSTVVVQLMLGETLEGC